MRTVMIYINGEGICSLAPPATKPGWVLGRDNKPVGRRMAIDRVPDDIKSHEAMAQFERVIIGIERGGGKRPLWGRAPARIEYWQIAGQPQGAVVYLPPDTPILA